MNLFSGLEKFGLKSVASMQVFEEEQKDKKGEGDNGKKEIVHTEEEFLFDKTIVCCVCDKEFKTKRVKNGRVRMLKSDPDLRPRFQFIDTLKYGITSCPFCGYAAINRNFEHLAPAQRRLIKEQICSQFQPTVQYDGATISYEMAIDRYKLSLLNAIVKKGRASEKSYICLNLAWLLREKASTMPEGTPGEKAARAECQKEGETFYGQAYEGFLKAISQEMFPLCGMEESTVDYLLAYMSFHFKKFDISAKFLSSVITSPSASRRAKDMALELRNEIRAILTKQKKP